jgi:rSAM/selenodomain-associated transferase 1
MRRGAAVIVFCRNPSPGRAKTRLQPKLGAWGAARLQRRLSMRAMRTARAADCGEVELHATPRHRNAFFRYCADSFGLALKPQRGTDLGERMYRALKQALRRHRAVILIGSDCPALSPRDLRHAERLLRGACDVVLAPTLDGGYALIGARRVSRALFMGIEWGAARVFQETQQRLESSGYRWRVLRTVWDVDRPEDLERLRSLRFYAAPPRGVRR